jgi:hypothetical protein
MLSSARCPLSLPVGAHTPSRGSRQVSCSRFRLARRGRTINRREGKMRVGRSRVSGLAIRLLLAGILAAVLSAAVATGEAAAGTMTDLGTLGEAIPPSGCSGGCVIAGRGCGSV